ncbi:hypothetical protein L249_7885 [Ophiocordyceps polyrhachis-furcata BCC 54312]|uniref:Uncharacterized protein n=1 Tax=Ophiocordyceps polyrhachis-furcata BCC 54312 TaxID=1330021 RepID=A0A367L0S4_9HYPO|nr:hypothetical protein L249_7885 [Ophiocordyceps polyrhachis-furcata BCC 54312]
MGKKWVCLLKSVGKVESNEVFCGAVEEEEGGKKLVEMEIIMSNQNVDHVIEKKKTNHVIVVLYSAPIAVTIAVTSRSGAMTAIAPL